MKIITLLTLILALSSCSFSESGKDEVASTHDDLEFAVDTIADQPANTDFQVEEQKIVDGTIPDDFQSNGQEVAMVVPEEPSFKEFSRPAESAEIVVDEVIVAPEPKMEPVKMAKISTHHEMKEVPARIKVEQINPVQDSSYEPTYGEMENYRVQKGDTLMMIAFKIYGDYRKWKDIKHWNKDQKLITEGIELKYYVAEKKFGWVPKGNPYLVKTGDTLQIVSMDKYGTTRKWKSIYENNRPLIRNPNLIFAGFTIYYQPLRDLASRPK